MSLLSLSSQKVAADTSPVAPADLAPTESSPAPNAYESLGTISEAGGLGVIFGHSPFQWLDTSIPTTPEPLITTNSEAIAAAGDVPPTPQEAPGHQTQEVSGSSGWTFADTLKKEVASLKSAFGGQNPTGA